MNAASQLWPLLLSRDPGGWAQPVTRENLHDQLCDRETLAAAGCFVLAHPAEITVEDLSLAELRDFRAEFFQRLQWELRAGAYQPAPVIRLCRLQRRSAPDYVRVLSARDRVVCVALFAVLEPVLAGAAREAADVIPVLRDLLLRGCYRMRPVGQGGALSPDDLWALLRECGAQIHEEPIRRLIKRLMRAQLSDEVRLAG